MSLTSKKVGPENWDTCQSNVDDEDFLEVCLVADHESQTQPASNSCGEKYVISERVDAVGEPIWSAYKIRGI